MAVLITSESSFFIFLVFQNKFHNNLTYNPVNIIDTTILDYKVQQLASIVWPHVQF